MRREYEYKQLSNDQALIWGYMDRLLLGNVYAPLFRVRQSGFR